MDDVRSRPVVTRLRGRITSLSAGGCALVLQQAVARQVLLRIGIDLVGGEVLECEAEIVSTAAISGGRYLVRVKFLDSTEEEREVIAKYVLKKQQARLVEKSESR